MKHAVVVWDPRDEVAEGTVVEGPRLLDALSRRGVALLPVEPGLLERNAVAGYFRRAWGKGVPLERKVGQRVCPMLLYVVPEWRFIHWVAAVERVSAEMSGIIRLVANGTQPSAMSGGLGATEAVDLGRAAPDATTVLVGGVVALSCASEGYFGLNLYGAAEGCRILWSAVSQARTD